MRYSARFVVGVIGLLLGVSTLAAHAWSQNKVPTIGELVGSYSYADDRAKEEASIQKQVDTATSDMGRMVLKRAIPKLKAATMVPKRIDITQKGSNITFKMDDHVVTVPENGAVVDTETPLGESAKGSYNAKNATLLLETSGKKTNSFQFNASDQLVMHVRITNSRLTQPIDFTSVFTRQK